MQSAEVQGATLPAMGSDQLARRVLAMVDSPPAWLGMRVRIHRWETDGEREWDEVMKSLSATAGLQMDFDEEGALILQWEALGKAEFAGDWNSSAGNDETTGRPDGAI